MSDSPTIARIRVTVDCPECAYPIPVNGVAPSVLCHTCQAVVPLEDHLSWYHMMHYAPREAVRQAGGGLLLSREEVPVLDVFFEGMKRLYRHFQGILVELDTRPIACGECRTELQLAQLLDVLHHGVAEAHCHECGAAVSVRDGRPFQDDMANKYASLVALIGETAELGDLKEQGGGKPVLFSCLGCGAPLEVGADTPRLLTCKFCSADNYIPDALWLRLHPAQRKRAFYMVLSRSS